MEQHGALFCCLSDGMVQGFIRKSDAVAPTYRSVAARTRMLSKDHIESSHNRNGFAFVSHLGQGRKPSKTGRFCHSRTAPRPRGANDSSINRSLKTATFMTSGWPIFRTRDAISMSDWPAVQKGRCSTWPAAPSGFYCIAWHPGRYRRSRSLRADTCCDAAEESE
jgi:hypothetical protein